MSLYTFYMHDRVHSAPDFELRACINDEDARAQALQVLAAFKEYDRIEIWRDLREPFTVSRAVFSSTMKSSSCLCTCADAACAARCPIIEMARRKPFRNP